MAKIRYVRKYEKRGKTTYDIVYQSGRERLYLLPDELPVTAVRFIVHSKDMQTDSDDYFGSITLYR